MTVNSGEIVQFPVIQEDNCPFCTELAQLEGRDFPPKTTATATPDETTKVDDDTT